MSRRPELTGLTALRLFAALFVLLFHSRYFAEGGWLEIPIYALFSSGSLGVDIFFVLSGFVISYVYIGNLNFGSYLLHRTARIYPIYLVTTIAALIVISTLGGTGYTNFDNFDILMNLFMLQGWYGESVNFVSWTVSAEWSVYLMFPAIIWLTRALPVNWVGILLPVFAYALLGGLAWAGLPGPINKCLFLFCSGVMLFKYWKEFGGFGSWIRIAAILSVLAMISLEAWFSYFGHPLDQRYLSVFAIPIVAWGINWKTSNYLLLVGGRASYSIYLVHGVTYIVVRRCIEIGVLDRVWGLPLFWLLSIGIALATYHWIEQPARRWIVNKFTIAQGNQPA